MMFDIKHKTSYPQWRSFYITDDPLKAEGYDGLNLEYGLIDKSDGTLVFGDVFAPIGEVLVGCGMLLSKSEFRRKLKEGAIRVGFCWGDEEVLEEDVCIPLDSEALHSVRFGQKYAEFIIPELFGE